MNKFLITLGVLICSLAGNAQGQTRAVVTVYAAASLKDALDGLLKTQGPVKTVYAASSTLARQIEHGAPADLFISADSEWMDYLAQRKLLREGSRVDLLTNRLVLITPAADSRALAIAPKFPLAAALGQGRLALAEPESVPSGKYAKAALQSLGVWNDVARKIAPSENVRAAMLLVARGETPLGIVYASDAVAEKRVRVLGEFPPSSHAPIVYPAALLGASNNAAAPALLAFLRSAEARALWQKYGFGVPE